MSSAEAPSRVPGRVPKLRLWVVAWALLLLTWVVPEQVRAADVVVRDPAGRHLHLRRGSSGWRVTDARGKSIAGTMVVDGDGEVILVLDVRTGREVGPYRILKGRRSLEGKRLRVRVDAGGARLVIISPPTRFEEPAEHLHRFGVPIVASVEGAAPDRAKGLSAVATISKDGSRLCRMSLANDGFGFLRGRFMHWQPDACGAPVLEAGGGSFVIKVVVSGGGIVRVDERALYIPEAIARQALWQAIGPIPVSMRATMRPPEAIHRRGRFFASANIRGTSKLKPESVRVSAQLYRNGVLVRTIDGPPVLEDRGAGIYSIELRDGLTEQLGRYAVSFTLDGRLESGDLPYQTSARLFEFAVRSVEPPLSLSIYFQLNSAAVEGAINSEREVDLDRVRAAVLTLVRARDTCRIEVHGYASRDVATAKAALYDLKLSEQRAKSVREWIMSGGAVLPGAFADVRGLGQFWEQESESEEARAKNRRSMINVYCD